MTFGVLFNRFLQRVDTTTTPWLSHSFNLRHLPKVVPEMKKSVKLNSKKSVIVAEEEKNMLKLDSSLALNDGAKEVTRPSSSSSSETSSSTPLDEPTTQVMEEAVVNSAPKVFDKLPDPEISEDVVVKPTFAQLFEGNMIPGNGMKLKHYDAGDGDILNIPDEILATQHSGRTTNFNLAQFPFCDHTNSFSRFYTNLLLIS